VRKPIAKKKVIKRSKLEVIDIAIDDLLDDEDNPNVQDEATFDLLVDEIREHGFDEPIQVRPHPTEPDKYQISSGHHRTKAARVIGLASVPAVIKHYDDREQKIHLAKRNALRGNFDKIKLAKIYNDVSKGRDPVQVQRELGFTNPKKFDQLIEQASKNMTPKQKKKLAEAKEEIKTLDDLSSVLNRIFKESGSEVDEGYMCFSFGGKDHHYVKVDDETNKKLHAIGKACEEADMPMREFLQSIVNAAELPKAAVGAKKKRGPAKGK
jgi:hypothetical protein